ncbi:hypothetical protein PSACC_01236 [Paramicrosporidium saccamoebae]|uniref:UBX domain-containing protein n=1 Tax=Paramicrosporidium saccamoebae TaxID=1246581 RepID=A0A2H9TML7_9FUNG|nr:hypothetical protein PSACC_01236 [Paramicrosporidium saccamoebae]
MDAKSYPSTVFLTHIDRRFVPLKRISGFHSAPLLLSTTHDLLAAIASHEDAAIERESEVTGAQQLREEQDAAYLRSLEADRKKEMERAEAERIQREEEKSLQLEEEKLNKKQQERNALLEKMKQALPEECIGGDCIKLSLQLFDGQRVIRNFNPSDPLSALYNWAFTLVGHNLDISLSEITIRTMLPPVHFENSKVPLLSAGEVQEHLAKCPLDVEELDLSHNKLGRPEEEGMWEHIWRVATATVVLRLSHNRIYSITVPTLPLLRLEVLDLAHNELQSINGDLFTWLPNLVKLRLEGNQLTCLPSSIGTLQKIRHLSIGGEIGGNQIERLPDGMDFSPCMEIFDCSQNKLLEFPSFISAWDRAEVIKAGDNEIVSLPSIDLSKMTNLKELCLQGNSISKLPDQIRWPESMQLLNLCNNKIAVIPASLLKSLPPTCTVLLAGNPCVMQQDTPTTYSSLVVPSLLELAARRSIQDSPIQRPLTPPICAYLNRPVESCAFCPMRFLQPCARVILNQTVRGHADVPTEGFVCSLSCPRLYLEKGNLKLHPADLFEF